MKNRLIHILTLIILAGSISSCEKYLEAKSDKKLAIPDKISDLQLILDSYVSMNQKYPVASEILSDNYYVTTTNFNSVTDAVHRNFYIWQKDENVANDWINPYGAILTANVVLDQLKEISYQKDEQAIWDNVKGSALFFRSYYFFSIAQLFCKPYDANTANQDPGIPLRLNSDIAATSKRSTVKVTYEQIVNDLKIAADLLPVSPLVKTRPSKPAAYGALAKVYLLMKDYTSAVFYADLCIKTYGANNLLDYNNADDVAINAAAPFKRFNKEVVFHIRSSTVTILANSRARIDSNLYNSYASADLRKIAYFKNNTGASAGSFNFKGDYDGAGTSTGYVFAGIVLDEIYLIRAECYARAGNTTNALEDLNTLMQTRWETGSFIPFAAATPTEALAKILIERRKELPFRGTRWADLRRLKDEPLFAVTPKRIVNNITYELTTSSPRYTLLFPKTVIDLSGMPQND